MLLRLDHLVIAVPDPEAAAAELEERVGLRCTGGGRHTTWGTYNRLAFLGDTYIELIGVFDRDLVAGSAVARAVLPALDAGRRGLVTFAIATDGVAADAARLRAAGSDLGPIEGRSRTRPDGEVVRWQAAYAELGPARAPFLVEHELVGAEWGAGARAERAGFVHPFGAAGRVAGLRLPVPDPAAVSAAYERTIGLPLEDGIAHLGDQWIRLVAGEPLADPAEVAIAAVRPGADLVPRRTVEAVGVTWRIVDRLGPTA